DAGPFDKGACTMLPRIPESWPVSFAERLNTGDLDSVMELYEPGACFLGQSSEPVVGKESVSQVVGRLINAKTHLHPHIVRSVVVGNIALLYTDWDGTTIDSTGGEIEMHSHAIEVLRQQSDSTWKLIIGDPGGRSSDDRGVQNG